MKFLFGVLLLLMISILSSCGFFRSIGLYNVPPNYSESYEEITGKKFIDHQNKKENLKLDLKTVKSEYSPYEEVELILYLYNTDTLDTAYICEPSLYSSGFHRSELSIKDSLNRKIDFIDNKAIISYTAMVDDYGRRITPTLAPNGTVIAPKDSLNKVFLFRTDKRICDNIECRFTFSRENIPGYYKAYYTQYHEEYDELEGPIPMKLNSTETDFYISNYSTEELIIRKKVNQIISAVYSEKDSTTVDSLYSNLKNDYPTNIYIPQIKEFLELYSSVRKNKKK